MKRITSNWLVNNERRKPVSQHYMFLLSTLSQQLKCHFEVTFDPRNNKHELQIHECKKLEKKV